MSQITMENIKSHLGKDFDEDAEYKLAAQRDIPEQHANGFRVVGQIEDFTTDQGSTMAILAKKETK